MRRKFSQPITLLTYSGLERRHWPLVLTFLFGLKDLDISGRRVTDRLTTHAHTDTHDEPGGTEALPLH